MNRIDSRHSAVSLFLVFIGVTVFCTTLEAQKQVTPPPQQKLAPAPLRPAFPLNQKFTPPPINSIPPLRPQGNQPNLRPPTLLPQDNPFAQPTLPTQPIQNTEQSSDDQQQELDALRQKLFPDAPNTAEELLELLDAKTDGYHVHRPPGKLSEQEVEKAVKLLRERYPITSLRPRLGTHATPRSIANDIAPTEQPRSPFFNSRVTALQKLHSDEVNNFVNSAGNGFSRMPTISPYDLKLNGRYATRLQSKPIESDLRSEPQVALKSKAPVASEQTSRLPSDWIARQRIRYEMSENGMPTNEMATMFHAANAFNFAPWSANGLVKNVDEVAGFEAHRTRFREDWNQSITMATREQIKNFFKQRLNEEEPAVDVDWKLNRMQLVSLLLHDEARVYVSDNLPDMEELSGADVETRGLDPFELNALNKLRNGEAIVTAATPNRLQMMGGLRATQDCMQCHNVKEDDLLGAFSYEFLRDPKLDLKARDFQP